jgi:hypothetical protein
MLGLGLSSALACSRPEPQRASDSTASASDSVPAFVHEALTQAYPGWRVARLSPAAAAAIPQARQWISADFDGDGRADHAVQIVQSSSTSDSAQLVVVFLFGDSEPIVVAAGPENDIVYLSLAMKGDRVRDLDANLNGDSAYVLATDGIHINFAEKASMTCRWMESGGTRPFLCRTSGD